jgi:hypothetical protein
MLKVEIISVLFSKKIAYKRVEESQLKIKQQKQGRKLCSIPVFVQLYDSKFIEN